MGNSPTRKEVSDSETSKEASRLFLRSWKEIAAYLKVTPRTAQRWRNNAKLPVQREGSGRVIAYVDELDEWLNAESQKDQPPHKKYVVAASLLIVIVLTLAAGLLFLTDSPHAVDLRIKDGRLEALDESGEVLWDRSWHKDSNPVDEWRWPISSRWDEFLIEDIDGDGDTEYVVTSFPEDPAQETAELFCFDHLGKEIWKFSFGRPLEFDGRRFSGSYIPHFVRLVTDGTQHYILTVALNQHWFPTQVALLDPATGRPTEEYWHPGGISHLLKTDLDADGVDEVLLAGVNNPGMGMGSPFLAALKIPFSAAAHSDAGDSFFELTNAQPFNYVLFPRMDLNSIKGLVTSIDQLRQEGPDQILVRMRLTQEAGSSLYFFDNRLNLTEFRLSDNVLPMHDSLYYQGILDHRFSTEEQSCLGRVQYFSSAPNANDPAVRAFWDDCEINTSRSEAP